MLWSWHVFFTELSNSGFAHAAWATLWSATIVEVVAVAGGFGLALAGRSRLRPVQVAVGLYVWLWRGTPLLVQLLIAYFGLPEVGVRLGVIGSGVATLILNESAYLAVLAAGTLSAVPSGQLDASKMLGLSRWTRFSRVVFPQAFRNFLPVLGNQYNAMLKTTSLLSIISFTELVQFAQVRVNLTYRPSEVFAVAGLYYLAMTVVWDGVQWMLERRLGHQRRTLPRSPAIEPVLLPAGT